MGRNIVITPKRNSTAAGQEPSISFSGLSAGTISLLVEDDGSLVWDGDNGGLFSIADNKDGLLHSVNDISGLPILQVFSTDRVILGKWDENALIVDTDQVFMGTDTTATESGTKLFVSGGTQFVGGITYVNRFAFSTNSLAPTGVTDSSGVLGEIRYDDSYQYLKTANGWSRQVLNFTW